MPETGYTGPSRSKNVLLLTGILVLSFIWGVGITPLSIKLSRQYDIVDLPGGRKVHQGTVPRGAGIVMWSGYTMWLLFVAVDPFFLKFSSTAAVFVFVTGYLDDMRSVDPLLRFFIHLMSAFLIVYFFDTDILKSAILLLWITGMISAYNLIDGLDGLCLVTFLISAFVAVFFTSTYVWIPLIGLGSGILIWNFPVARTFLGDGGSTLLGLLFSSHFVFASIELIEPLSVFSLAFILFLCGGIPVADTLFAILRRSLKRSSPFEADRLHFHHRLLDAGVGRIKIVLILGFIHFIMVLSGFVLLTGHMI
jgi:UDP-GlcNAc:undecaprenyl-phosphate GlcNAc-1-phosphate transferase